MSVLFWNLGRRDLAGPAARLVHEHAVDVLVLAECQADLAQLSRELTQTTGRPWWVVMGPATATASQRLPVLTWLGAESVHLVRESVTTERLRILRVRARFALDFLLAVAHLPSKLHRGPYDQASAARWLAQAIDASETETGHRRTILVGDLNMNPFEPGVVAADALHVVMTGSIATGVEDRGR